MDRAIQNIGSWLMQMAMSRFELDELFTGFCEKAVKAGVPVGRCHVALSLLHPTMAAQTFTWRKGQGLLIAGLGHESDAGEDWLKSPLKKMLDDEMPEIRGSLERDRGELEFELFQELQDEGYTDYLAFPIAFHTGADAIRERDGMMMSWVCDQPGGFMPEDMHNIQRLSSRLAVVIKLWAREQVAHNVARAYLGHRVGHHVLSGHIRRGDAQQINAIIWYADLRGSTDMADTMPLETVTTALNDYFDCVAGSVLDHQGDVLRFIGDAVLAIFPFEDSDMSAVDAHRRAYAAAIEAFDAMKQVNARRKAEGEMQLSFGLALHPGRILYGNIGIPERVEFSVIGGAVNETARIEALTKELEEPLLMSEAFTERLQGEWRDLGEFELRGVKTPKRLFAPAHLE